MALISTQLATELVEGKATTLEDGERYIDIEVGYGHDWMPLEEAIAVINAADGVVLRDDYLRKRPYRLMAITKEGSVIRFEVDE
jgi:hypothetical protein